MQQMIHHIKSLTEVFIFLSAIWLRFEIDRMNWTKTSAFSQLAHFFPSTLLGLNLILSPSQAVSPNLTLHPTPSLTQPLLLSLPLCVNLPFMWFICSAYLMQHISQNIHRRIGKTWQRGEVVLICNVASLCRVKKVDLEKRKCWLTTSGLTQ